MPSFFHAVFVIRLIQKLQGDFSAGSEDFSGIFSSVPVLDSRQKTTSNFSKNFGKRGDDRGWLLANIRL